MTDLFYPVFFVLFAGVLLTVIGFMFDIKIFFKFVRGFFGLHEHNWRQILGSKKYSLVCKSCGAMK